MERFSMIQNAPRKHRELGSRGQLVDTMTQSLERFGENVLPYLLLRRHTSLFPHSDSSGGNLVRGSAPQARMSGLREPEALPSPNDGRKGELPHPRRSDPIGEFGRSALLTFAHHSVGASIGALDKEANGSGAKSFGCL